MRNLTLLLGKITDYKVKSGVLQLTLGISLVISILCASIILIVFYGKLSFLQQDVRSRLRDNAISGIHYVMANRDNLSFNEPLVIDLFGDGTDSAKVVRRPWGIFELYMTEAWQGSNVQFKAALITPQPSDIGKAAIYTADNHVPLYLVGKTLITGTVYASDRKFSTGYIDGLGYKGDKFVLGEVKKGEPLIPVLDTLLLSEINMVATKNIHSYRLNPVDLMPVDSVLSFQQMQTSYYFSNQSIELSDSLGGNLIIHSAVKVHIGARARLRDILIVSPDIDIDKGFHGSIQCFATHSITVGADSKLDYPSALVLFAGENDSTIVMHHDAIVEGVVVIQGLNRAMGGKGVFRIDKGAIFHGMAYINGSADIQGTILGHITTRTFQAEVKGAVYGNYLLNAEINGVKRSMFMPASFLWGNTKELVVAKWIE